MRDHRGLEWLRPVEVVDRLPGVTRSRVDVWVHRRRVRSLKVGSELWVCWQDCAAQEVATRSQATPLARGIPGV